MIVGHFSDLHGKYTLLTENAIKPDLWISTGDFFPNRTRGTRPVEIPYQDMYFRRKADELVTALMGVPVVVVDGNHDFVRLAPLLREFGVDAHDVADGSVELFGLTFSGFPHIPYIEGEWNYEAHEVKEEIDRVWGENPDVLITHAPASGILASAYGWPALTNALFYRTHKIRHHFFGHVHEYGGQTQQEGGITFVNSATTLQSITI